MRCLCKHTNFFAMYFMLQLHSTYKSMFVNRLFVLQKSLTTIRNQVPKSAVKSLYSIMDDFFFIYSRIKLGPFVTKIANYSFRQTEFRKSVVEEISDEVSIKVFPVSKLDVLPVHRVLRRKTVSASIKNFHQ